MYCRLGWPEKTYNGCPVSIEGASFTLTAIAFDSIALSQWFFQIDYCQYNNGGIDIVHVAFVFSIVYLLQEFYFKKKKKSISLKQNESHFKRNLTILADWMHWHIGLKWINWQFNFNCQRDMLKKKKIGSFCFGVWFQSTSIYWIIINHKDHWVSSFGCKTSFIILILSSFYIVCGFNLITLCLCTHTCECIEFVRALINNICKDLSNKNKITDGFMWFERVKSYLRSPQHTKRHWNEKHCIQ